MTMNQEQIQRKIDFIQQYIKAENAAEGSKFDANANVSTKNVATMEAELFKDYTIQLNRGIISRKIEELFGKDLAVEYVRQLEAHEIYTHDESSLKPYCVSMSMYPLLLDGLTKLGGESKAPKHLESYVGSLINLIFAVSSQFAGAVAGVEALMYFSYFARKDYGDDYLKTHTSVIENLLQHFVYSINQPAAARGFQSVFFNLSVYDEHYFNGLFEDFVFPDEECTRPDYKHVAELQEFFLDWFRREREKGALLTFPVITAAMLVKDGEPVDKTFAQMCSKNLSEGGSFFVYMSESADSLASCCFDKNQDVLIRIGDSDAMNLTLEDCFDTWKASTDLRVFHDNSWIAAKPIRVARLGRKMFKVTIESGIELVMTEDHLNPTHSGDRRTDSLTTEDYLKCLGGAYIRVKSIEEITDYEDDYVYCMEVRNSEEPYFTLPNGVITHNCRLRSEFADNTFSYSLGAGGVATGSLNVITINFNRLIQQGHDLGEQIDKIHRYQVAHRKVFEEMLNAKMLTVYDAGFIHMDKQFLTIGINGMVEAAEYLGITPDNNQEYIDWVSSNLKVIYDKNKAAKAEFGYMFNTEFVPAENLGVKNSKWDKEDGLAVTRDCYNSYFYVVEDESTNIIDKFKLHGKEVTQYLDGGSALHLNLEQKLSQEGFYNLLKIAAKSGCNYFCTNVKITICNKCEHLDKRTLQNCPKCGSNDVDYATRVIGYLKRISSFSKARKVEAGLRHYHKPSIK